MNHLNREFTKKTLKSTIFFGNCFDREYLLIPDKEMYLSSVVDLIYLQGF